MLMGWVLEWRFKVELTAGASLSQRVRPFLSDYTIMQRCAKPSGCVKGNITGKEWDQQICCQPRCWLHWQTPTHSFGLQMLPGASLRELGLDSPLKGDMGIMHFWVSPMLDGPSCPIHSDDLDVPTRSRSPLWIQLFQNFPTLHFFYREPQAAAGQDTGGGCFHWSLSFMGFISWEDKKRG